MEDWWNDNDSEKIKLSLKNLSQCQSVHHKSHKDWPRIESRLEQGLQLTAGAMGPSLITVMNFEPVLLF